MTARAAWRPRLRGAFALGAACAAVGFAACAGRPSAPVAPAGEAFAAEMDLARAAFDRGEVEVAGNQFERALRRARARDDSPGIAAAAYNLGACRLATGRFDDAREALVHAAYELDQLQQDSSPAWLLMASAVREAGLARRAGGAAAEALSLAERALSRAEGFRNTSVTAQARVLVGLLAADRGDARAARAAFSQASGQAPGKSMDAGGPAGLRLESRVLELEGQPARAAEASEREAALLQAGPAGARELLGALARAARNWAQAGDPDRAAALWLRAARSAWAMGDPDSARAALDALAGLPPGPSGSATDGLGGVRAAAAALSSEIDRFRAAKGAP